MPAVFYDECMDFTRYWSTRYRVEPTSLPYIKQHFEECIATNLYRDGFWRWFFSSMHCYCPCHEMEFSAEALAWKNFQKAFAGWLMVAFTLSIFSVIIGS